MKSSANAKNSLRLQVFLSRNGVCSRRQAMSFIQGGRVLVNGVVNSEPSTAIDPQKDEVIIDGKKIQAKRFDYVMLNKPQGFVTTRFDRFAEKTVYDLLSSECRHLVPVGRLDKDTEGLLLLTNDGDLVYQLTHPKHDVDKVYFVRLSGLLKEEQKKQVEQGVIVEGRKTAPAKIKDIKYSKNETELRITIHEGRKRQVRLMFGKVGLKVVYLKRIQQGNLKLDNLPIGKWRFLKDIEIEGLKNK